MSKKFFLAVLLISALNLPITLKSSFAAGPAADYLCELGATFYSLGRYDEALSEFNKALLVDPDSAVAKKYINDIFKQNFSPEIPPQEKIPSEKTSIETATPRVLSKDETMDAAMKQAKNELEPEVSKKHQYTPKYSTSGSKKPEEERGIKAGPFKISGSTQLGFGITSNDFIWKRANFDLNEKFKSWRMLSDAGYNRRFNTYDPAIYDSLSVNVDTENKQGFNFHTNITVDPWSFTGKSDKTTITGSNGDAAQVQLLYWSNTGLVVNQTAYTYLKGDSFGIPEIKVKDGVTSATTASSYRYAGVTYNIPEMKVKREFQPLRELWFDYTNDQVKLRAFPMGYQDQAYTSDDPLGITNHGIWWKDSKWLRQYTPGNFNSGDVTPSYTKGRWDDSLSFLSKDSTGKYLTGLRGFALNFQPGEATSFDTTIATPKNLWQDYAQVDNVIMASRLKHYFADNFMLGGTFTNRSGFMTEKSQKLDSLNFVAGADLGYEIVDGLKAQAEVLTSQSKYDMSNSTYETDTKGNAYYFSFVTRYPQKSIMDLKYGYEDIAMDKDENFLVKSKFYLSRMDKNFDSALSDYHNTRQDVFWSRHIHFRKPLEYFSEGLAGDTSHWDELNSSRIGDGIDSGRSVLGFRFETFMGDKFSNLFDVRNVHGTNGKFIENVARDEATVKVTDKLTAKGLGIYHKLPKTTAGIDPFVYDGSTGEFYKNDAVLDGLNPTIKTGSFGLNYDFFDWLSLNGTYERTNDYTLAYGDFPRNVLRNDTSLYGTFYQNDNLYRNVQPFLYNQGVFPQAPYEYYNVFKTGLRISPLDNLEIYLDYTRNEFDAASLISDSMNHVGLEIAYMPTRKMGILFKYVYSRSKDITQIAGTTDYGLTDHMISHHNFSSEFRYLPSKDDEFILQYGVGDATSINNLSSLDPYGGGMLTLDTQHIIRAYYRRKF
jgi:hypothetical protein